MSGPTFRCIAGWRGRLAVRALAMAGLAATVTVCATPPARADEPVFRGLPKGTNVVGAGTLAAWWAPAPGGGTVLVSHSGKGPAVVTKITGHGEELDAGLDADGRPTIIWRVGREVRAWRARAPRTTRLTTLPAGALLPALWGNRLAFVRTVEGRHGRCREPFLRDLRTRRDRAVGGGRLCRLGYLDTDLDGSWLVVDADEPNAPARAALSEDPYYDYDFELGGLATYGVLAISLRSHEKPFFATAYDINGDGSLWDMELEGNHLYTEFVSLRNGTRLRRLDLETGEEAKPDVYNALRGTFAIAGDRFYTLVATDHYLDLNCGQERCIMLAGGNPFSAAERLLPAELTAVATASGRTITVTGRLARARVKDKREVGVAGVAGAGIEVTANGGTPVAATTAPDGTWSVTFTMPPPRRQISLKVDVTGDDPASQPLIPETWASVRLEG